MQKALNFPPLRVRLETSCPNPAQAKEPGVDALQQRKRRGGDLCPSWGSVPSLRVTARSSSLEVDVLSQFPWKQEEVGKEMGSECSLPAGRAAAGAGMRWLRVFAPKPGGGWVREGGERITEPLRAQHSTQMQPKPRGTLQFPLTVCKEYA